MATVVIPSQLRKLTDRAERVDVEARDVAELIDRLEERYPGIGARLRRGNELRPGLSVAVDGTMSSRGLMQKLTAESEVHFLPAIGGG